MRVALVHYHLRVGGVTTVIRQTAEVLGQLGHQVIVLTGQAPRDSWPVPCLPLEGLDYSADISASELADGLQAATSLGFASSPADLWHFHNHGLGKNAALPGAANYLAKQGERLLLQFHDFAEDHRPENYAAISNPAELYPASPRVHYATVNRRDLRILRAAGLAAGQAHYLPNPLTGVPLEPAPSDGRAIWFYPTRGIPRKNLAEAVLLAAVHGQAEVVTSRRPENPAWLPAHRAWEDFARAKALAVRFGVVNEQEDFASWLHRATAILTTSVGEGFGLVFLEAALWRRPLVGRALPAILADFEELGLAFPGLYESLEIPGLGDFGWLPPDGQRMVVEQVLANPETAKEIMTWSRGKPLPLPLWLARCESDASAVLDANRALVERHFSLPAHGQRLTACYGKVMAGESASTLAIDYQSIRSAFTVELHDRPGPIRA